MKKLTKKSNLTQLKGRAAAVVGLLTTGSSSLDELLGGGIESGSALLVLGMPHCGKKQVLMNLTHAECCTNSRPVIFILTDVGAKVWQSMMKNGGWECEKVKDRLYIVDGYSQQFGVCTNSDTVECMEVPFALSTLSIETSNFLDKTASFKKKPMVILHSVSTLFELFGEEETFRFLQFFIGKIKSMGCTLVLSMQMGMHDPKIESLVSSLVDCVLEMKDSQMKASGYKTITIKQKVHYSMVKGKLKLEFDSNNKIK